MVTHDTRRASVTVAANSTLVQKIFCATDNSGYPAAPAPIVAVGGGATWGPDNGESNLASSNMVTSRMSGPVINANNVAIGWLTTIENATASPVLAHLWVICVSSSYQLQNGGG